MKNRETCMTGEESVRMYTQKKKEIILLSNMMVALEWHSVTPIRSIWGYEMVLQKKKEKLDGKIDTHGGVDSIKSYATRVFTPEQLLEESR